MTPYLHTPAQLRAQRAEQERAVALALNLVTTAAEGGDLTKQFRRQPIERIMAAATAMAHVAAETARELANTNTNNTCNEPGVHVAPAKPQTPAQRAERQHRILVAYAKGRENARQRRIAREGR